MRKLILTALAATCAMPASAGVVYSNNFDSENGGNTALNYSGFNGLTVTNGTVDLVKSGDFGIICAGGGGACVDLDGSTFQSGLVSSNSYAFGVGDHVALSFDFSGNQRGGPSNSFDIRFNFGGSVSGTFGFNSPAGSISPTSFSGTSLLVTVANVPSNFPMGKLTFYFDPTTVGSTAFSLLDHSSNNIGIVIDNLSLSVGAVPEPATWAMMIAGFGLAGAALRRRSSAMALA